MEHQDLAPIDIGNSALKIRSIGVKRPQKTASVAHANRLDDATEPQKTLTVSRQLALEIAALRNSRKLTQKAMATRIGVSQPIYASIESGKAQNSPETKRIIQKIRTTFGVKFSAV